MIAVGIILFSLVLLADLYIDYKKWIQNRSVNHTLKSWERAIFLMPSGIFLHMGSPYTNILSGLVIFFLMFAFYWFLFDGLYNVIRGYDWWFLGSDDGDDSRLDDFLQSINKKNAAILKVVTISLATLSYLILWLF